MFFLIIMACSSKDESSNPSYQTSSTIDTQGGTISVSDVSSPINGFKMVIPADALSSATTITVKTTSATIPLPQTVSTLGSVIELLPEGLIFSKPISITVPYSGDTPPTIVTYNSASSSYSILPTTGIDAQNKTITVITNHFSWLEQIVSNSYDSIPANFTLGVDTFKINNTPKDLAGTSANVSGGGCWGFVYYSQWYFKNKRATDGNLHEKYINDLEKWIVSDAQESQEALKVADNLNERLNQAIPLHDVLTFHNLYNAIQINNIPQALSVTDSTDPNNRKHVVLVYAITKESDGWVLDVYDNTDSTKSYPIRFDGIHFQDWKGGSTVHPDYTYDWFTFNGDNAVRLSPQLEEIYNKYKYSISGMATLSGAGLPGATITINGPVSSSVITDSNGGYIFNNFPNGTYTLTSWAAGFSLSPSSINNITINSANITGQNFTATASIGKSISLTATPTSLLAGQSSILFAIVNDSAGNPLGGQVVNFAFANNNSDATMWSVTGTTDASGIVVTIYTAGTNSPALSVEDTIEAIITGASKSVIITREAEGSSVGEVPSPPEQGILSLTAEPTSLAAGQSSTITATVTNASGIPVQGETVTFTIYKDSSAMVLRTLGTIPLTATTDASGQAVAVYTGGVNNPTADVQDIVLASISSGASYRAIIITRQEQSHQH